MEIQLNHSITPFNLDYTLSCGQVFRWEKIDNQWFGIVQENVIKIRHDDDKLVFQTFPEKMGVHFIKRYFGLDTDLPHILFLINKDEHVKKAIQNLYGLRLIRQEPWECLISYICATNKNILAIKKMVLNLSQRFGKKINFEGRDFYTFPKPGELAEASIDEIRKCKLGFRTERVLEASRMIYKKEFDLETIRTKDYEKAKHELMSLSGVGHKVADCVLLFSLNKFEAFPVDVWVKRIIIDLYANFFEGSFIEKFLRSSSITSHDYMKVNSFGREYFGEYAGYAQEYLFHFKRIQRW